MRCSTAYARLKAQARPARFRRPDRNEPSRCSTRSDAAWVLYKLDSGVEHILVDEAQDTSRDAMGNPRAARRGFHLRRGRARERPHIFRGRRREAVDLFVPGRGAENVRRDAPGVRRVATSDARAGFRRSAAAPVLPLRAASVLEGVDQVCSACRGPGVAWREEEKPPPHEAFRDRAAGSGRNLAAGRRRASAVAGDDWLMPLDAPSRRRSRRQAGAPHRRRDRANGSSPGSRERVHDAARARPRPITPGDILDPGALARRRFSRR